MVLPQTERNFFYGIRTQILLPSKIRPYLRAAKFSQEPPKDDYEEYARTVIGRAYFIVLNRIDDLDGTNERLLEYYQKHIEKCIKL